MGRQKTTVSGLSYDIVWVIPTLAVLGELRLVMDRHMDTVYTTPV